MHVFAFLGLFAFVFCYVLTPLCRDFFIRSGLVDEPDNERRFHVRAVPRMGGVPIAISYGGSLAVVFFFTPGGVTLHIQHMDLLRALLPAASIIFFTGLLDDLRGLTPRQKLAGQALAAVVAVAFGIRIRIAPSHPALSSLVSILWLIACSNAVNLIDGLDGLATGVGLLATVTTVIVALLSHNIGLALATIPLAGCLLAFLRYNFSPATVFLGDCGSLTIGFLLGCFGLAWGQRSGTLTGMVAPLMVLSLPLLDVGLAIGRRFLRAVPIFQGDRGHIHHRVQALGFSTRHTTLLLYGACTVAALLAILTSFSRMELVLPILLLFGILVAVGIHHLRYVEFSAFTKAVLHTVERRAMRDNIYLEELTLSLVSAPTIDAWWSVVCDTCRTLRFASAHMELNTQTFHEEFVCTQDTPTFRIQLGLGEFGYVIFTRLEEKSPPPQAVAVLYAVQQSFEHAQFACVEAPAPEAESPSTVASPRAA